MAGSVVIAASLATSITWLVTRSQHKAAHRADSIVFLAPAVPTIVTGVAFQFMGIAIYHWLPLFGTIWLVAIAMGTRMLAYCTRTMHATSLQIQFELDEAAYVSGVSKLDGSLKKIKDLGGTAATKNSDWIEKLDAINTEMSSRTSVAAAQLWDSQKSLKRWPVRIGQRAPNFFCLEDVTTLEQSLGGKSNMLRTFYRLDFQRELERVWLLAQPEGAAQGPQKVRFPLQDMPTPSRFPWESVDPSIEEIYSAQEDLWLISSLLMAVREVNSGTVSVIDSHVKELQLVQSVSYTHLTLPTSDLV